ncbi:PEP-CTERM system TPR-repeat protein PrsT [Roseomonas sp. SSH11]|uniref:PEP-CTERM system TPR-repeat protein PrsT n=1 Tax=Pararoseomonas baculiformis TaxID=2820812 RepID=A0ABS4ADQ1_9PROT|nr:XrtA/PEP-CTERM system TPR-repeat protein PrsT [Pararoseomonas baculiformis]MBP0445144.1 PEP-CTERM system TPR-repeat protein PrsT [Pararoseomonas baculiformis]
MAAPSHRLSATLLLGATLLAAAPAHASLERARAAQARGELRTAQIELRNAVRAEPNSATLRAALAQASLDVGEPDAAEREIRAAMEAGYDRAEGTALLLRTYVARNRFRELLNDFPAPGEDVPAALAGRIMAARAMAQISLNQRDDARRSAAEAVRRAPDLVDARLAASVIELAEGDKAGAEAEVDRALAIDPGAAEALLRKAALQFGRGDARGAAETAGRLVTASPGHLTARLQRAEALMALGEDAAARADVEAALRTSPGSPGAIYMRALLSARAENWRGADEDLQRLGGALTNIPGALLVQARVKRAMGQTVQAEDAARRHVARYPEDVNGGLLLAVMEMEGGRPDAAAGTLTRLTSRGVASAPAFDLLGRAHTAMGRGREAVQAFTRASELAPEDSGILSRLAAARLRVGDTAGMTQAAQEASRIAPDAPGARQLLALSALGHGDLRAAEEELSKLTPESREGEPARVLQGMVYALRLDAPRARAAFEGALAVNPDSVAARLGLARLSAAAGDSQAAERLWGEVLARAPDNSEALTRLSALGARRVPEAASARAVLTAAQAAHPAEQSIALALASSLIRSGDPAAAAAVLESAPLRSARRGPGVPMLLAEARAAAGQWAEAETASRAALAEDPTSSQARQRLAAVLAERGDMRGAEALLEEGLRSRPADPVLLGAMVSLASRRDGVPAALSMADRLADRPGTRPASSFLKGDVLLGAGRSEEAARAYAAAYAREPSLALALRQSQAWRAANRLDQATAALTAWLEREPASPPALTALAQLDLAAGRTAEAERRLTLALEGAPGNVVALNNLAWLKQGRGDKDSLARATDLAELAYYMAPTAEIADTLGWIRVRTGRAAEAVPLLRQAVSASAARGAPDPSMSYRLAVALRETGAREEALRVLQPAISGNSAFSERAEAERLAQSLRAGG